MARPTPPRRLGRGLSSLIAEPVSVDASPPAASGNDLSHQDLPSPERGLQNLPLSDIIPNINQPRRAFDEDSLERLAASIRVAGVIQPIVVRRAPSRDDAPEGAAWEIIAGERRWRAAQRAGLAHIPAVVVSASDRESAEWALVENVQREDLNPVERAEALKRLRDEFGLTQSQVAEQVGLDRATVANFIRLTDLEPEILDLLRNGRLSAGHGKALLAMPPGAARLRTARTAADDGWSVRRLESNPAATPAPAAVLPSDHLRKLEKQLGDHLGTKLAIKQNTNGTSGTITLRYFDLDHFDGLMEKLNFRPS